MNRKWQIAFPIVLMMVFTVSRWPGILPENFSALYALAFCGALYFPRALGWWLPLAFLIVSDVAINAFYYNVPAFHPYVLVKVAAVLGIIALAKFCFSPKNNYFRLLGGGLLGAVIFYLVTNTASWMYDPKYSKTLAGWFQALTVGLPGYPPTWEFFRNTLLSGGLFTGLFAGAMKVSEAVEEQTETEEEQEPENASPEKANA